MYAKIEEKRTKIDVKTSNMVNTNNTISILTLYYNQTLSDCMKKTCCPPGIH